MLVEHLDVHKPFWLAGEVVLSVQHNLPILSCPDTREGRHGSFCRSAQLPERTSICGQSAPISQTSLLQHTTIVSGSVSVES